MILFLAPAASAQPAKRAERGDEGSVLSEMARFSEPSFVNWQSMFTSPNGSGLRDKYSRGSAADFLRSKIRDGSQVSVVSAYCTIYAYDALQTLLDRIDHLR